MIKSFAIAVASIAAAAPAALAGPYANVEHNHNWVGSDGKGGTTDFHVGYSTMLDAQSEFFIQGGASYLSPQGDDGKTVPSAKAGLNIYDVGPVDLYGEVSFTGSGDRDIDKSYNAKVGVRYEL